MGWAEAEVWQLVLSLPPSEGDERLRYLLHHIHFTQHAFLKLWAGLPVVLPELSEFKDIAALAKWGKKTHDELDSFISHSKNLNYDQPVAIPWAKLFANHSGQPPQHPTLVETMLQVSLHSSHHRGQVNTRLRELGVEPRLTDYIVWIWRGKPPADWPKLDETTTP